MLKVTNFSASSSEAFELSGQKHFGGPNILEGPSSPPPPPSRLCHTRAMIGNCSAN